MNFKDPKKMRLIVLILISFLMNIQYSLAQNMEQDKKNIVYISYGNIIFSSQVAISYERMVFKKNELQTRAKVNYGNYLSNNADYETNAIVYEDFFSVSAVQLLGLLEVNAGMAYAKYKLAEGFEPDPDIDYTEIKHRIDFYGNIGIRYTKNDFLIRAGISNLELLHVGIGLNF